jgi:L-threonylcarbamoyladenylate synthase
MQRSSLKRTQSGEIALPENFTQAVKALHSGELVVFPTETFYGIGADPMQSGALARLARVKGRDPDKPIALIAADKLAAFGAAREVPDGAFVLAETFWPGPLTLVLPARAGIDSALIGPGGGIGVRVSPHPIASALAREAGGLITATSANLSGEPPALTIAQAHQSLGASVSVYLDGGQLTSAAASTVLLYDRSGSFRMVRPGVISIEAITAALRRQK